MVDPSLPASGSVSWYTHYNWLDTKTRLGAGRGEGTNALVHALPNLVKTIRTMNDSSPTTVWQIDIGSSVGQGPDGTPDLVNAVGPYLFAQLPAVINKPGNLTLAHYNGSANGTTITSCQQTDYAAAKVAAGNVLPNLVPIIHGMNDGMTAQYHQGETYPGVYANGKTLIQNIQADGADPIIFTTPHPKSTLTDWSISGGLVYPSTQVPPATTAGSIVTVTSRNGTSVPASYRHLRVNESLRQLGADMGVPVLDVEVYWFDAIADYGENALFSTGQFNHPNLLGFQRSYFLAVDDFIRGLNTATAIAAPLPPTRETFVRKFNNTTRASTTTLAADPELAVAAVANGEYLVEFMVHYTAALGGDIRLSIAGPTGATGRFTVTGPSAAATGSPDQAVFRSTALGAGNYIEIGGNNTDGFGLVTGTVVMGSTAGNISLMWCQDTSNATNTLVYAGSSARVTRIA